MDRRQYARVVLPDSCCAERIECGQHRARLSPEPGHIDPEAGGGGGRKVAQAAAELIDRAAPIPPAQMVEADTDLQDPLVEVADMVRLRSPEVFQCLVALPI